MVNILLICLLVQDENGKNTIFNLSLVKSPESVNFHNLPLNYGMINFLTDSFAGHLWLTYEQLGGCF